MSPRKVRLVIDAVRGLPVEQALVKLDFIKKDAAYPVKKLLLSAIANAEHNLKQKASGLYIKKVTADGGPMLKRWAPRAFGRAAPIRKRTSHIEIVLAPLSEKPEDKKSATKALKAARRDARRESWLKVKAARHAARDAKFATLEKDAAPAPEAAPAEKKSEAKPEEVKANVEANHDGQASEEKTQSTQN